jgi:hypothetical protein
VLLERAGDVFDLRHENPYMLMVVPVREDWKTRVPAITHVDGTARVQTVDSKVEPLYHSLISAFERKTGIPLIVNTSFNLRGMPIVESPYDALQCFLFTDMDCLYLGRFKLNRPDPSSWFPMISPEWDFNTGRDMSSEKHQIICKRKDGAKQIAVDTTSELIDLCTVLDGGNSMQEAFDRAYGRKLDQDRRKTVFDNAEFHVLNLARQGAILIRAGKLIFGMPQF